MKHLLVGLALTFTASVFAQDITISDFKDWKLTDISEKGFTKEQLFTKMNRDFIKLGGSICSNRALIWAYDFKRFQKVDAGKLFLFYTKKTGEIGKKTWWYHVTPIVNEKGSIFALDAGFPGMVKGPLTPQEWLKKFAGTSNCKEIQAHETDLLTKMFEGYVYPETTSYGTHDCYYKISPAGYWTPAAMAMNLLGVNAQGKPVNYVRDEINKDDVYEACTEASTRTLGRVFGSGKKKCKEYLGL